MISGATRGIGRECAIALAREGCDIVVTGKSVIETEKLPGSIYSVAKEVEALGVRALPLQLDVMSAESCEKAVELTIAQFGKVDILINNASALWWQEIGNTPVSKYDLITRLNARGSFILTKACLPHMIKNRFGRVVCMSPPIITDYKSFKGMTAYNISKCGMTMVAMGAAAEGEGYNVTGVSLWPATVVESQASINFKLGDTSFWRKASILADATVALCCEDESITGSQLIDDDYLRSKGLTDDDLVVYRYNPDVEPPRALALKHVSIQRGDVKKLNADLKTDLFSKM